jgi:prepilin-type N-terminal cleavage/methylation domain-containing protein
MKKNSGFSILELLVAIAVLSIFVEMSLVFSDAINRSSELNRTIATRERISSAVRNVAGMPAALRSSIRASLGAGSYVNQDLNNCVAGTVVNACKNDQVYPLTLYSPTIAMDASGIPLGLLPITAPVGSPTPSRFDSFGVPCADSNPNCPFRVYTSFRPQCPPPPLPAIPPPTTDPSYLTFFKPMATCTIAEAVHVVYSVEVDPAAAAGYIGLSSLTTPITGTVTTSVKLIFGNDPR